MGKRIISRRRGAGTGPYRSPSHRHKGAVYHPTPDVAGAAIVTRVDQAPGRSAPVVEARISEGPVVRLLAPAGIATGDTLHINRGEVERGSLLPLSDIPDGTLVSNLEVQPFDGGRLVRAAGTSALVVQHAGREVTVQLPSGVFKTFLAACRAQVGAIAGGGRLERPFAKAGKKVLAYRALAKAPFKVRGVAMNPVNHPHGGGAHQHVGRPSTVSAGTWPGAKVGRFAPRRRKAKGRRTMPGRGR
jgi:large subunit ribosomal protein L2